MRVFHASMPALTGPPPATTAPATLAGRTGPISVGPGGARDDGNGDRPVSRAGEAPAMTGPRPRRRGPARAPTPRWALVAISGLLLASPPAPARGGTLPTFGPAEGPAFGPVPLPPAAAPAADPARLAGTR